MAKTDKDQYELFSYKEIKDSKLLQFLVSDERKRCPLNFSGRNQCASCKIALPLISEENRDKIKRSGNMRINEKVFVCPLKMLGMESMFKLKAKLNKAKKKIEQNEGEDEKEDEGDE